MQPDFTTHPEAPRPVPRTTLMVVAALLLALPADAGTPVEVGWRDFDYGNAPGARPTAEKPQSKLWINDGLWWGCLWDPGADAYRIHRFELANHDWISVGPDGDDRGDALVDALWDGQQLHIVSQDYEGSGNSRLYSYDYDSGSQTYSLRSGFPVDVSDEGSEAITIDKDTTGKLWVTWEQSRKIYVRMDKWR